MKALGSRQAILLSLLTYAGFLTVLFTLDSPVWETNDDVGMSMISAGYGFAHYGSPEILFSNVLWGHVTRILPDIFGLNGYAVGTYIVLGIVSSTLFHLTNKATQNPILSSLLVILIMWKPVIEPQFTINAGLLMVAAIGLLILYVKEQKLPILYFAAVLAFLSAMIRDQEALLVILVALPAIFSPPLIKRRQIFIVGALWLACFTVAYNVNIQAYSGEDWENYRQLNPVRAAFTDFRALTHLKKQPELIAASGMTLNDLSLIRSWFFVDPETANPETLNALLADSGFVSVKRFALSDGINGIKNLSNPYFSLVLIAAFFATFFGKFQRLILVWLAIFAVAAILGMVGRSNVPRIYYPLATFVLFLPFWASSSHNSLPAIMKASPVSRIVIGLVLLSLVTSCFLFSKKVHQKKGEYEYLESFNLDTFEQPIAIWGASLPYEYVFPIRSHQSNRQAKIIGFGVSTLAPFTVSANQAENSTGFPERFLSETGILLLARPGQKKMLKKHCELRHAGFYSAETLNTYPHFSIDRVRCVPKLS